MKVKELRARNFKNFENLDVKFNDFNVVIGANASGKSNFVEIFKFLRDIARSGLENAISMQGGVEYLRNIKVGKEKDLDLQISLDTDFKWIKRPRKESIESIVGIEFNNIDYEFSLRFHKKGSGFRIIKDRLIQECNFVKLEKLKNKKINPAKKEIGRGKIVLFRDNGKVKIELKKPKGLEFEEDDIYPSFLKEEKINKTSLLLQSPFFLIPPYKESFSKLSIYDLDPKLPKKATPISGKAELEEDGSNLSIILRNITKDKKKKEKLFSLVKDILPFVGDLSVEKFADKSLLFKLKEKYFEDEYLPATSISDGTINITALILALYFEDKPITIIEEPERNIHPKLMSKIVEMMEDAAKKKQIIITTHNPEIVKHTDIKNLMFLYRESGGSSKVIKPSDREAVKTFLKSEIGIEELYVQDLLGA